MVENLPIICKALSAVPSPEKQEKKMVSTSETSPSTRITWIRLCLQWSPEFCDQLCHFEQVIYFSPSLPTQMLSEHRTRTRLPVDSVGLLSPYVWKGEPPYFSFCLSPQAQWNFSILSCHTETWLTAFEMTEWDLCQQAQKSWGPTHALSGELFSSCDQRDTEMQ